MQKRKKPKFIRQGGKNLKRVGLKWRTQRGSQNKLRKHRKSRGHIPQSGYGSPKSTRGLHPSGYQDILVHNLKDLEKINPEKQVCRIASAVGKKKRFEILKKAGELKIKILNPQKIEEKGE